MPSPTSRSRIATPVSSLLVDANLERQILSASRSVEEVRRLAYRDPSRIGQLVEQISVLADLRQKEGDFRKAESLYREALYRAQELKKPDPELLCGIHSLLAHLYDRWGKTIFFSDSIENSWTGKAVDEDAPEGVYVFKIDAVNKLNEKISRAGTVTLIR